MSEHTKEPWKLTDVHAEGLRINGPKGEPLADVWPYSPMTTSKQGEANARRIVACVNACAGLETEMLERDAIAGFALQAAEWAGLANKMEARAEAAERLLREVTDRLRSDDPLFAEICAHLEGTDR